jgi:hypothetical protein
MSNKLHLVPQNIQDIAASINTAASQRNPNFLDTKLQQLEETRKFCETFLNSYYKAKK